MLAILLLLQSSTGAPPDVSLHAQVRARQLTVEKTGEAHLQVIVDPPGRKVVEIEAPQANGRKTIDNPVIKVNVEGRIADPAQRAEPAPSP